MVAISALVLCTFFISVAIWVTRRPAAKEESYCETCKHFIDPTGYKLGDCRRGSPALKQANGLRHPIWPEVEYDMVCGEHEFGDQVCITCKVRRKHHGYDWCVDCWRIEENSK